MMTNMETGQFGIASKTNQTTEGKRSASTLKTVSNIHQLNEENVL